MITSSNTPPQELYRDGLQRSRFLPAIGLLTRELDVLQVDGGVDYRLRQLRRRPIYLDSQAPNSTAMLQSLFDELAAEHGESATELSVCGGRTLRALRRRAAMWSGFSF